MFRVPRWGPPVSQGFRSSPVRVPISALFTFSCRTRSAPAFGVCVSLQCATTLSRLSHCRGAAGGLVACRGLPGWALVQGDRAGMQRFLPRVPKSSISLTHWLPLSLTASFQGARRPRGRRTARCPPVRRGKSPGCAGRGGDRGCSCPCTDFPPVLRRAAPAAQACLR